LLTRELDRYARCWDTLIVHSTLALATLTKTSCTTASCVAAEEVAGNPRPLGAAASLNALASDRTVVLGTDALTIRALRVPISLAPEHLAGAPGDFRTAALVHALARQGALVLFALTVFALAALCARVGGALCPQAVDWKTSTEPRFNGAAFGLEARRRSSHKQETSLRKDVGRHAEQSETESGARGHHLRTAGTLLGNALTPSPSISLFSLSLAGDRNFVVLFLL